MTRGHKRALDRAARKPGSNGLFFRTVLIDKTIVIPDPGAAVAFASAVIEGLPQANLWIGCALAYFTVRDVGGAGLIAAFQGNFAVGTTPTANATLDTTKVNIIPSTVFTAAAGVTPRVRVAPAADGNGLMSENGKFFDNTDGSLELNGNITILDASISAQATVRVQGEIHLVMATMGDD
jgi:hypothetical protein